MDLSKCSQPGVPDKEQQQFNQFIFAKAILDATAAPAPTAGSSSAKQAPLESHDEFVFEPPRIDDKEAKAETKEQVDPIDDPTRHHRPHHQGPGLLLRVARWLNLK